MGTRHLSAVTDNQGFRNPDIVHVLFDLAKMVDFLDPELMLVIHISDDSYRSRHLGDINFGM